MQEGRSARQQTLALPTVGPSKPAAGDNAVKKKSKIFGQIIELLTVHTYIENEGVALNARALLRNA